MVVSTNIPSSELDNRKYNNIILDNGIKCLVITDEHTHTSYISVNVKVGSIYEDICGVAHFLEHLVFMGNEEYPDEKKFAEMVQLYDGKYNAYTSTYNTNYHVEINNNGLADILRILSYFFKTPLLSPDCIERELNSINNEFLKNVNNYGRIMHEIMHLISADVSLYKKHLSVGNSESLNNITHEKIREFFDRYYVSENISLCIITNKNMDEVSNIINTTFGTIVKRPLDPEALTKINSIKTSDFYTKEKNYYQYQISGHNSKTLYVWEIAYYEIYSVYELYVEYMNIYSNDSIVNLLKKYGYIKSFNVHINDNKFFIIELSLTENGNMDCINIEHILLTYLNNLHKLLTLNYIDVINFLKEIEQRRFTSKINESDMDYAIDNSSLLSYIDNVENILRINICKYDFFTTELEKNPKPLGNLCTMPYKVIYINNKDIVGTYIRNDILYYDKSFYTLGDVHNNCNKQSNNNDILDNVCVNNINECMKKHSANLKTILDKLSEFNNNIKHDKDPHSEYELPKEISLSNNLSNNSSNNIWYCFDDTTKNVVHIAINIHNKCFTICDNSKFMTLVNIELLKYLININLYILLLFYFKYTITFDVRTSSITIAISTMNNHTINKEFIIDKILDYIKKLPTYIQEQNNNNIINNIRENIINEYINIDNNNIIIFSDIKLWKSVLTNSLYNMNIGNLSTNQIIDIIDDDSCLKIYVHGDISKSCATNMFEDSELRIAQHSHRESIEKVISALMSMKYMSSNNYMNIMYHIDTSSSSLDDTERTCIKMLTKIFVMIYQLEFFDYIRTKNQLGYIANLNLLSLDTDDNYINMTIITNSEITHVAIYINTFKHNLLKYINEDIFNTSKQNYAATLIQPRSQLKRFDTYSKKIINNMNNFNENTQYYNLIEKLTYEKFTEYITEYIIRKNAIVRLIPSDNFKS